MTVEELSHATADRYADRMMHEMKSAHKMRHPPRLPPPISARESFETKHTPPRDDDDDAPSSLSARVGETESLPTTSTSKTVEKSLQERFQDFYADFEHLEPMLSTYLTPQDKKRFVQAIRGPNLMQRPEVMTAAVAIVVVVLTAVVCLGNASHHPEPRLRAAASSSVPDTSSTTNFNIQRILRPLNRNH